MLTAMAGNFSCAGRRPGLCAAGRLIWVLFGVFFVPVPLLLFGLMACQPEREPPRPPTVELDSGAGSYALQVPDTLRLGVRIHSVEPLEGVVLRIQRMDGVALQPPQYRPLSGHVAVTEWVVPLVDPSLPSGQFQVVVQATAGGQTGSLFLPLQLTARPRRFGGVLWFLELSTQTAVYRSDSLGMLLGREALLGYRPSQCVAWPGTNWIWLRGATTPILWRYRSDSSTFSALFTTLVDAGQAPFTHLAAYGPDVYASRGMGDVIRITAQGIPAGHFPVPSDFLPVFSCRQGEQLLVELRARPPASLRRVRIYHADYQGLLREFSVSGNLLGAARISADEWLLLVELPGQGIGRLWRYSMASQQLLEESPQVAAHSFRVLVAGRGDWWLGGDGGVWNWRPGASVQTGVFQQTHTAPVSGLFFDSTVNRLVGWHGRAGWEYEPQAGSRSDFTLPDSIRFALPLVAVQ